MDFIFRDTCFIPDSVRYYSAYSNVKHRGEQIDFLELFTLKIMIRLAHLQTNRPNPLSFARLRALFTLSEFIPRVAFSVIVTARPL